MLLLVPGHVTTLEGVIGFFTKLGWRMQDLEGGGRSASAVIGGDRATGDIVVIACIEGGSSPLHQHTEGEVIHTWAGVLYYGGPDDGIFHTVDDPPLVLDQGSQHAPHAKFWVGIYRQPKGSTLVT